LEKGRVGCIILAFCIGFSIWYFSLGGQMLESWGVEDKTREQIIVGENYRLDGVTARKYSDDWWYISIYVINQTSGDISWNLIKYNSLEDRYVYDELKNIEI